MCLGVVHLDVAALDVAGPGVEGVWTPVELDGEPVPGDECWVVRAPGSPWSNTKTLNRPGSADVRLVSWDR